MEVPKGMENHLQLSAVRSRMAFDSVFNDNDEFIGPEEGVHINPKKIPGCECVVLHLTSLSRWSSSFRTRIGTVAEREHFIFSARSSGQCKRRWFSWQPNEEHLRATECESLWTDFLTSLQQENHLTDTQPTSIANSNIEEDDNDDP